MRVKQKCRVKMMVHFACNAIFHRKKEVIINVLVAHQFNHKKFTTTVACPDVTSVLSNWL